MLLYVLCRDIVLSQYSSVTVNCQFNKSQVISENCLNSLQSFLFEITEAEDKVNISGVQQRKKGGNVFIDSR